MKLARGDLMLEAGIVSDTAPLPELMERFLVDAPSTRWLRDATRGGVGPVCNELAPDCNLTVVLDDWPSPFGRQWRPPASCLGSTRCTWPNRGEVCRGGEARGGRRARGAPQPRTRR